MNANMPAHPFIEETKTVEGISGASYTTATGVYTGFSKREELSARFGAALLPLYVKTANQYESQEAMIDYWSEASVGFADALIKQWEK